MASCLCARWTLGGREGGGRSELGRVVGWCACWPGEGMGLGHVLGCLLGLIPRPCGPHSDCMVSLVLHLQFCGRRSKEHIREANASPGAPGRLRHPASCTAYSSGLLAYLLQQSFGLCCKARDQGIFGEYTSYTQICGYAPEPQVIPPRKPLLKKVRERTVPLDRTFHVHIGFFKK